MTGRWAWTEQGLSLVFSHEEFEAEIYRALKWQEEFDAEITSYRKRYAAPFPAGDNSSTDGLVSEWAMARSRDSSNTKSLLI